MKCIAAAAAALLALALSSAARAEVDFFVGSSADVLGSIRPAGDEDVIRFIAPKGSRVSIVAHAVTGDLALGLALADEQENAVSLEPTVKGRSLRALRVPMTSGGVYALTVSGTGAGEYRLSLRVRQPRRVSMTRTIEPGYPNRQAFEIAALPTSYIVTRIASPADSPAWPCVENVGEEPCRGAAGLSFRLKLGMRDGMTVSYEVSNGAAVPGDVRCVATIRPPAMVPKLWDLRAANLGFPAGGETAVAVPWNPTKFTTVAVSTGSLAGTAIRWVAANTSDHLGTLGLTSVPDPSDAELEGLVRVGPTAQFVSNFQRAPGERFGPQREEIVPPPNYAGHAYPMELPYDPALLPPGADAAIEVSVLRIGGVGRASLMDRKFAVVDPDRHVVVLRGSKLDPFVRYCAVVAAD